LKKYSLILRAPIESIELKSGSHAERINEFPNLEIGFATFLDNSIHQPEYKYYPYIYLKYVTIIKEIEYQFISKPFQITKEKFRKKIISSNKKEILIYVNPKNLHEYYYEFVL